jgi:HEPN domain-containing protein
MKNQRLQAGRWLAQSLHELDVARLMLREGFHAYACFYSQQGSVMALKSLAYLRGDRYVIGHSVIDLVKSLTDDFPEVARFKEAAGQLDRYYLTTRYPDALPGGVPYEAFHEKEATAAVDAAASVVEFARTIVAGASGG